MRPRSTISCEKSVDAIRPLLAGEDLSDEPLQYADASQWQNDLLESEDAEEGRKYWRERNVSTVERLRLPAQGSLSGHSIFAPRLLSSQLERDLSANIATLARKYETSPSVLLLSCWQILLWRLSGQSEFVVGVTSDGRTYEGLQEALGLFGKSLPMICHLEGGLRLSELLERTEVSAHDAIAWQEYFSWDDSPRSQQRHRLTILFAGRFRIQRRPREILRRRRQLRHSKAIHLLRPICAQALLRSDARLFQH